MDRRERNRLYDIYATGISQLGLRLLHSLIQATVNIIMLRFLVFTVATVVLGVLAVRTALAIV